MIKDEKMISLYHWVKNIGNLMIGVATIIISIVLGVAANNITKMQITLQEATAKNEQIITKAKNNSDRQLKTIDIFLTLIRGNSEREKEMAVRLLRIIDEELALDLAISVATNKSEADNIARIAFRIGKQIDPARFFEGLLKTMNISLSDDPDTGTANVRRYFTNQGAGYRELAEVLYLVMGKSTLSGQAVPLDIINAEVLKKHNRSGKPMV